MTNLIEITENKHNVIIDIRYASSNNFTGAPVYKRAACYLNNEAEIALKKAIKIAADKNLKIKIFDAFRPLEIQKALWNHTPDPNFLSNPETGSCPHCRGVAVDLTLLDKNGNELDMGTEFDTFSPLSHHGNNEVPPDAQKTRELLKKIMTEAGWDFYKNEWWHYQLFDCRKYPLFTDKDAGTGMV